jgi:raffinose synthase
MQACECRWRDTAVARASDDFYPRDPASSTPHISACAFLSLFLSPLVQPDWDMFHRCNLSTVYSFLAWSRCSLNPVRGCWSPLIKPSAWCINMCGQCTCSKHPAAVLHAMARVLSGGSIYVSDYPGQHDFEVRC